GCAPAGRGEAPSAPTARANDFRAAQVRQAVVLVRVVVASTSELSERDRKDLPALYESALLEALDARAILVRDVRWVEAGGPAPWAGSSARCSRADRISRGARRCPGGRRARARCRRGRGCGSRRPGAPRRR